MDRNPMTADEVQKYLQDIEYPASKADIVANAESTGAPQSLIDKIRSLDQDTSSEPPEGARAQLQGS